MPFLLRIILQRILLFAYSVLAFLGIAPEVTIPTEQEAQTAQETREEIIADIVTDQAPEFEKNEVEQVIQDAEKTLEELTKINEDTPPVKISPTTPLQTPTKTTSPATEPAAPTETELSVRDLVVNIVCVRTNGDFVNVSTGSGVLVSPRGVVLTNAHVAQFFLIEAYDDKLIDCSIYKETTIYGYTADIVYISPEWIKKNYKLLSSNNARGTGEDDYALLYIDGNTNPALSLPQSFPSADIDLGEAKVGDDVVAAGYPGGPTSLIDISRSGKLKFAPLSILEVFTFTGSSVDVFTASKSEIGAKGSSGGGVFYGQNANTIDLAGIIVTTDGTNGNAKINAITTSYINDDLIKDTDHNLDYYLRGNIDARVTEFKENYLTELVALLLKEF